MPYISKKDQEEYLHLKSVYARDLIQESLAKTLRLEDDIDLPIKNCVAAFALLGCKPMWSCCGFNYAGQPIHKKHQIGRCYFVMDGKGAYSALTTIALGDMPYKGMWEMSFRGDTVDFHADFKNVIDQWNDIDCIHYSEQASIYIGYLEKYLMSMRYGFADSITIEDSNRVYKENSPSWQYPPKESWVVTKEDLLARYTNGLEPPPANPAR